MSFFVENPLPALRMAGGLLAYAGVGFLLPRVVWPALAAAGAWAVYAWYEWSLIDEGMNIRCDLFAILPVLLGLTLWAFAAPLRPQKRAGEKRPVWSRVDRS